jgi:hypothetical protein
VYRLCYGEQEQILFSCDYDGEDEKTITSGSLNMYSLGVYGDSVYFQNIDRYIINEMNVSNGNISRSILVEKVPYHELIFLDNSVPPIGELV